VLRPESWPILSAVLWGFRHGAATATDLLQPLDLACAVELTSGPATQSRHHIQTVQTTVEGSLFREA